MYDIRRTDKILCTTLLKYVANFEGHKSFIIKDTVRVITAAD